MGEAILADQPGGKLEEVVHTVCQTQQPVTVRTADGDEVKVIPVPKPVRYWKGRPVFRLEDTKYLYLDYPWLLE